MEKKEFIEKIFRIWGEPEDCNEITVDELCSSTYLLVDTGMDRTWYTPYEDLEVMLGEAAGRFCDDEWGVAGMYNIATARELMVRFTGAVVSELPV